MFELDGLIVGKAPERNHPLVFVDFDDVINVFDDYRNEKDIKETDVVIEKGTCRPKGGALSSDKVMRIAWRPKIVDALRSLNCVWLTSWKGLTQNLLNPVLGFDFGYADWQYRGICDDGFYGKLAAVEEIVTKTNLPFAVIDDSFFISSAELGERVGGIPALVVAPRPCEGLIESQLTELLAFITENTAN